jgi:periplasmic protein TonB
MMSTHIQQAGLLSGRSMTLMAVVGLHALVIAALIAMRTVPALLDSSHGPAILVLDPPPEPVPPEPQPSLPSALPAVAIPAVAVLVPVLIPIDTGEAIPAPVGVAVQQESTVQMGPAVPVAPVAPAATVPMRASTELQYRVTRSTDEYYPDASVALEEQGVAIVRVCVDAAGRMQGAPAVQESSGYKRLDKAAVRWAGEALRFTPATRDGVAVAACKGFRVKFDLH